MPVEDLTGKEKKIYVSTLLSNGMKNRSVHNLTTNSEFENIHLSILLYRISGNRSVFTMVAAAIAAPRDAIPIIAYKRFECNKDEHDTKKDRWRDVTEKNIRTRKCSNISFFSGNIPSIDQ